MNIIDFFKGIGHVLANVFGLIRKLVPEEQLVKGIELAKQAAEKFVDNADRRTWVANELIRLFHIPQSVANLIVELAVQHLKADAIDAAATAAEGAIAAPIVASHS